MRFRCRFWVRFWARFYAPTKNGITSLEAQFCPQNFTQKTDWSCVFRASNPQNASTTLKNTLLGQYCASRAKYVLLGRSGYVDRGPTIDWEGVYGFKFIYKTKHYFNHGGNPTHGYAFVLRGDILDCISVS